MPNYAERRTHQMRLIELRFGSPVPDLLRQLREEGRLTEAHVAACLASVMEDSGSLDMKQVIYD